MLKSLWLWLKRDRTFALLVAANFVLVIILVGEFFFFLLPPNKAAYVPSAQPGSNSNVTAAPVTTQSSLEVATIPATVTSAKFSATATTTPLVPTPVIALGNQGQDEVPPSPPKLALQNTRISGNSGQPPTVTPKK